MKLVKGSSLSQGDKTTILHSYPYRMTVESMRRWPNLSALMHGFKLPIISDEEWLETTEFWVTKAGRLAVKPNHCVTHGRGMAIQRERTQ